jgi:DUF971 family protein
MTHAIHPVRIGRRDPGRLEIDWSDGHRTAYTAAELRRLCPCAMCIHELTGQALLDPSTVPEDLAQRDVRLVGTYAIAITFSDGHQTGIYTFPYLRGHDPLAPGTS